MINPLLTKFDPGFFCEFIDLDFVWVHKLAKKGEVTANGKNETFAVCL